MDSIKQYKNTIVTIALILCLIPSVVHSTFSIFVNEQQSINYYIRVVTALLFALGIESTIYIVTVFRLNWYTVTSFVLLSIAFNILYYGSSEASNFVFSWPTNPMKYLLAIGNPICILVFSHIVRETTDVKKPKSRS